MTTKYPKMHGHNGSYFATVTGWPPLRRARIPCVHEHWLNGLDYHDPFMGTQTVNERNRDFFDVLRDDMRVVVTRDTVTEKPDGTFAFKRRGYVAIHTVVSIRARSTEFFMVLSPMRIDVV